MSQMFQKEEEYFLQLLHCALTGDEQMIEESRIGEAAAPMKREEWERLMHLALEHEVLSLLYEPMHKIPEIQPAWGWVEQKSRQIVQQSYHLLFLTKAVTELCKEKGIQVVVLKGAATASFYPVPELRKSGDIDLLVLEKDRFNEACTLLEEQGFIKKGRQYHSHHMEYMSEDGIIIELHKMLVEPFADQKINRYLDELMQCALEHTCIVDTCGVKIKSFSDGYHAYYLLIHMVQHFLFAGFGIRCLCDWVLCWNKEVLDAEKDIFLRLAEESGVLEFAKTLTVCCVRYLGLEQERVSFLRIDKVPEQNVQELMREILDAGEFGVSQAERMVAMQGHQIADYMKEFHHQMQLNYPNAGKRKILWPFLWLASLFCFWRNNRKIRKVSSIAVLKKAGQRSRLIQKMHMFEDTSS